jgi:hypothetical protein
MTEKVMTDTKRKIFEQTEAMRNAAFDLADKVDVVADEVTAASQRLGKRLRRVGDALLESSEDLERPATGIGRALDELGYEAKKSFDRITGRRPPPWYSRFSFWR